MPHIPPYPFQEFRNAYVKRRRKEGNWSAETDPIFATFCLIHGCDGPDLQRWLSPSETKIDERCEQAALTKARLLRVVECIKDREQNGPALFREILQRRVGFLNQEQHDQTAAVNEERRWLLDKFFGRSDKNILWTIYNECKVDNSNDREFLSCVSRLALWAHKSDSEGCAPTTHILARLEELKEELKIGKDSLTPAGRIVLRLLQQFDGRGSKDVHELLGAFGKTSKIVNAIEGGFDQVVWKEFWNDFVGAVLIGARNPANWPPGDVSTASNVLKGMVRICPPTDQLNYAVKSIPQTAFKEWLGSLDVLGAIFHDPRKYEQLWNLYAGNEGYGSSAGGGDEFDEAFVRLVYLCGSTVEAIDNLDEPYKSDIKNWIETRARPGIGHNDDLLPKTKAFMLLVDLLHLEGGSKVAGTLRDVLNQEQSEKLELADIQSYWENTWGRRWNPRAAKGAVVDSSDPTRQAKSPPERNQESRGQPQVVESGNAESRFSKSHLLMVIGFVVAFGILLMLILLLSLIRPSPQKKDKEGAGLDGQAYVALRMAGPRSCDSIKNPLLPSTLTTENQRARPPIAPPLNLNSGLAPCVRASPRSRTAARAPVGVEVSRLVPWFLARSVPFAHSAFFSRRLLNCD